MAIKQITQLDHSTALQLLCLMSDIENHTFDYASYCHYLRDYAAGIGLFGCFDDHGSLLGYVHAEEPHPVVPTEGFVLSASINPRAPKGTSKELLRHTAAWLKSKGATKIKMATERNPKAWQRALGFTPVREQTMEIQIDELA
ncbi:MAG: hypothetical protein LLF76_02725 [Planctomycetaceae bacterium]|nr:hypothetical protein [Planctomycetaceae bacterium]